MAGERHVNVCRAWLDDGAAPVGAADADNAARSQHPPQLAQRIVWTGEVLDKAVREHSVEALSRERQLVDGADMKVDVCHAGVVRGRSRGVDL